MAIARALVELLERFPDTSDLSWDIKELEHEGDRLTHDIVDLLNRTFVTPFDRDDMYRLASVLDDVCDHIDEAAGNILLYGIEEVRPKAQEQARRGLSRGRRSSQEAVGLLQGFKDRSGNSRRCASSRTRAIGSTARRSSDLFRSNGDAI